MNIKPILFSTPMVQAILVGSKIQTRRVVKLQPGDGEYYEKLGENDFAYMSIGGMSGPYKCPYGQVGDTLWVRESFCLTQPYDPETYYFGYKDGWHSDNPASSKYDFSEPDVWKPSIHMPKEACRIFLKIINVRVERLNQISHDDSLKEGIIDYQDGTYKNYYTNKGLRGKDGVECVLPKASFQSLWCSINGFISWEANPFVWVIEFERCAAPSNFLTN